MNCYVCDTLGRGTDAVAICNHCGVALCREHLDADLLAPRPQGLSGRRCSHTPIQSALARRELAAFTERFSLE